MSVYEKNLLLALSREVEELKRRVEALEAKPKRGRPPKEKSHETE